MEDEKIEKLKELIEKERKLDEELEKTIYCEEIFNIEKTMASVFIFSIIPIIIFDFVNLKKWFDG
jgi:mannose/fructose/N-acetylgalactosamine-specific phosphotransferase system component IID